ncbi:gp32 [Rhodococcus phage ReqiPine5]|uniref:Gp32 n=1 Tax=Rhodococcus phage ReqiPine5 TaxID=691963 RepID=D4P807_9CAUD|nr:gp32 [Rhodococcus phage ReqiPine5]ADD81137.1 gp32 [Rhodococcus phage ReqiPine5]
MRSSSTQLCVGSFIESDLRGLRMAPTWHIRPVAEVTALATKDGTVERTADPVDTITAEVRWTNTGEDLIQVRAVVQRPSRSIVTSNPNMVSIVDGVSATAGVSPMAPLPSVRRSGIGARLKTSRTTVASPAFGRLYVDAPEHSTDHFVMVPPGFTIHLRYRCAVVTPGEWRTTTNGVSEAWARFVNIKLFALPYVSG